ncbi:MAG: glycosyltransferase family 1 protein [Lachnospiraceae bacterium]|nr:glycosyltransferase family 1 protein [Lachnospiraceae bacterium]
MKEAFIRELKRKTLSFMHNAQYLVSRRRMENVFNGYDASTVENPPMKGTKTIAFVITRMVRFHGGQTSVLRLGTRLAQKGMKVLYLIYKPQSTSEMKLCAKANLAGYEGSFASFEAYVSGIGKKYVMPDIIVATSWDTVSYAKKLDTYRMYFVQDYEPYFYPFGEEFLMSRSTYGQGLHMVSLGAWNKMMIEKEAQPVSEIDEVSFPYEAREYPVAERDYDSYKNKKTIVLAVYVKYYGKRLPNLIPYILGNTAKELEKKGITLDVRYFGEAGTYRIPGGKNLGQLTHGELARLYGEADFGMVASMSNISLVPYEMHATGLPLIEFAEGTYPFFFPEGTALLASINDRDISQMLIEAIGDPDRIKSMNEKAGKYMEGLSWERTGDEFYEIIHKAYNAGKA